MTTTTYTVTITGCTREEAMVVMAERLGCDEDYGFDYRIDYEPVPQSTDWLRCPTCDSPDIRGGNVEITDTSADQDVWCRECDASWIEVYHPSFRELTSEGATK